MQILHGTMYFSFTYTENLQAYQEIVTRKRKKRMKVPRRPNSIDAASIFVRTYSLEF